MESKKYGDGSGQTECFIVEARMNFSEPKEYRGMILDKEWRRLHFPKGPIGIPNGLQVCYADAARQGYLDYDAALALAHWFMVPEEWMTGFCVETRIIKVLYKYQYSVEEKGIGPTMNITELRRATEFKPRAEEQK